MRDVVARGGGARGEKKGIKEEKEEWNKEDSERGRTREREREREREPVSHVHTFVFRHLTPDIKLIRVSGREREGGRERESARQNKHTTHHSTLYCQRLLD